MNIMKKFSPFLVASFAMICVFILSGAAVAQGIKILDPSYTAVTLVKDTPFPGVNGATIGTDGALYVVHSAIGLVTRIDLNTMKASTFVPPYAGVFIPDDITADDKGNFFVTGMTPISGEVYRIDKNGMKTVIASGFLAPNGIQYNHRTGRLFMTECFQGNRVFELDPGGVKDPRLIIKENVIPVPEGFGFDPDTNDLIIPDLGSGKILRVHPDTGRITTIAEKFVTPVALKVGPDKMAYIVELATGGVYRLSLDGQKGEKLAQIMPGLDNLAITPEGRLFVTSYWDATIFDVATDGSGKYKTLFPMGPNQPNGIVVKGERVLISDAIMVRWVENGKYVKTKLNAWATHGMPLPLSLADGPGDQVFWSDAVHGAVAIGNPATGKFKPVAGELKRPMAVLLSKAGPRIFVAEYGSGRITEVSLIDGAKKVLTAGLQGPLALTIVGKKLYVAEAKAGRISKVDLATGEKEVFLSGVVGKPGALGNDGAGNLLVLDGASQRLLRIGIRDLAISILATNLPVSYGLAGSYPTVEFPVSMTVTERADIYLTTMNRGVIKLEKAK
jgi:sugar lactone lactonase YvrE